MSKDEQIETGIGSGGHGRLHISADRHRTRISIVHPPDNAGEHKATTVTVKTADLQRMLTRVSRLADPVDALA